MSARRRSTFWALIALLMALGLCARIANFREVFDGTGVELVPADSHYYVRFARLQLEAFPRFQPFDPFVSFPEGAWIIWPPLHTHLVCTAVAAAGEAHAEAGAAWVGPIAAALGLLAVALVGRRTVGERATLVATALLALTPVAIEAGKLGNADHHVHEPTFAAAVVLLATMLCTRPSPGAAVWTGVVLGRSRLFTTTAFALIPVAALSFPLASLAWRRHTGPGERPPLAPVAWTTAASAAAVLALEAILFGQPASLSYERISSFHPLFALACLGSAAGVCELIEGRPARALVASGPLLLGVHLATELARAAGHLSRKDPQLSVILESMPLWNEPRWALQLLGLGLIALAPAMAWAARAWWRQDATFAPSLAGTLVLGFGAAMQARFAQLLSGAAAILFALVFTRVSDELRPRWRVALVAVGAVWAATWVPTLFPSRPSGVPAFTRMVRPTLQWMRTLPRAAPAYDARARPAFGVLAHFELGNLILLWSELPAVTNTISMLPEQVRMNERAREVLHIEDEERAYRMALELRARYWVATPRGTESLGPNAMAVRLLEHPVPSLGHFRLIHESEERRKDPADGSYVRVFELVPGMLLRGRAAPGAEVIAMLPSGYRRVVRAAEDGTFEVRVAYPGRYDVRWSGGDTSIDVTDEAIARDD